jgi:hypothetical protein
MMVRKSEAELRRGEAAAWGPRPGNEAAERPRLRLVSWKPASKGALRGFATVQLPIGLKLIDCPVLMGASGPWASLPSKPVLDRDGRHAKPGGKPQFATVLEWRSRELADRFSIAVVDLVRAAHPDALGGGAP